MSNKSIALGFAALLSSFAFLAVAADTPDTKKAPPAGQPEMKLPPGWTMEDMQACIIAGTPGKMQAHLAKDSGNWKGKSTMWMAPGAEPVKSDCTITISPIMDGRYIKSVMKGEMPGMGPYTGEGISGFDNVSQEFVSTWIDNHSSGIMNGTGKLSSDGKTLSWNYSMNCPLTKKPTTVRQIETDTSAKTKTIEMFATDPKSGKEYKMMVCEMTKE
jgi:hypothetical protein